MNLNINVCLFAYNENTILLSVYTLEIAVKDKMIIPDLIPERK